jgi:hypothetical protein
MGWQDRPPALIGVSLGLGVYLLALLALRDLQRRRDYKFRKSRGGRPGRAVRDHTR